MIDNGVVENTRIIVATIVVIIVLSSLSSPGRRYRRRTCQSDVDALIRASATTITKSEPVPLPSHRVAPTVAVGSRSLRRSERDNVAAA
jgi:hypothetical protein